MRAGSRTRKGALILLTTVMQVVRFAPRTVSDDDDSGCLTETDESLSRQTHTVTPPDLCVCCLSDVVPVPVPLALYTDKEGGGEEERERGGRWTNPKSRAKAQQIVTTRLLYCLHHPVSCKSSAKDSPPVRFGFRLASDGR